MPYYVVKECEQLALIVARECAPGTDVQTIVDDPKNEPLFRSRSPNVLGTGDEVWLPDDAPFSPLTRAVTSGSSMRMIVRRPTRTFRLKLAQPDRSPIANAAYVLVVGGKEHQGTTDGDGVLELQLPLDAKDGELHVGSSTRAIQVGGLEPLHSLRGIQGRLLNLGYSPGPIDGQLSDRTISAIKAFQASQGLTPDGIVNEATRARLKSAYGF
jgi:hypothetical protein